MQFLCEKYNIDATRVFVEYSSRPPPSLKGGRPGYYDGLLSFREISGRPEFLITVFKISRDPLLTLAHEFEHLVKNLESGAIDKQLGPPDDRAEAAFDDKARRDLTEFHSFVQKQ